MSRVEEARRQGFFPLVMLLERLAGGPPVGSAEALDEERIRFRHHPSLAFSTGDVAEVRELALPPGPQGEARTGYEVVTTFLGLTGGVTPLPNYMAEEVAQEDADAPRMREFLDLFHHRLLSLLYRGRSRYDLARSHRAGEGDEWLARLLALTGTDLAPGEPPPALPPWRLLRVAALLAEPTMTAEGLAAACRDALAEELGEVAVSVEPFAGAWVEIAADEVTRLGRQASVLGRSCLVGRRVLDPAGRFRVVVGPLSAAQYRRVGAGQALRTVEALVAAMVSEPVEHEIVLTLARDAAPALCLGTSRLGRDSWLGSQAQGARLLARLAA